MDNSLALTYVHMLRASTGPVRISQSKSDDEPSSLATHYVEFKDPGDSGILHSISLAKLIDLASSASTNETVEGEIIQEEFSGD